MDYEDECGYDDDEYYDERPGENASALDVSELEDVDDVREDVEPIKPNHLECDRIRFSHNIGCLRVVPKKILESPKPYWLTKDIKYVNLVSISDYINPKKACCTLINALIDIDPKKYPESIYLPENKKEETRSEMPHDIEKLFLGKVQLSSEFVREARFELYLPATVWVADTYKSELFLTDANEQWCIDQLYHKTIPYCVVKLVDRKLVPGKEIIVYRISIDGYMDLIQNSKSEDVYFVPAKCSNIVDLISEEDYKLIRSIKNVQRRNSHKSVHRNSSKKQN